MIATFFLPPESPFAISRSFWYADFRFWPDWTRSVCHLVLVWGIVSLVIAIFLPKNKARLFLIRRSFVQTVISLFFVFCIWMVWYIQATLPLATLFAPILSPISDYVYGYFTAPLADYYTTGEGRSPMSRPFVGVVLFSVIFVAWRAWYHAGRWRKFRASLLLICILPIMLGADESAPAVPQKVETSVGIYDVQSKDDLLNFTVEEIRELVRIEDDRIRGAGKPPHPVLVYCFEERSFRYTGGKYEDAEVKYRLRVPQKIVPGKKYPLAIHLHGVGEAGDDNTFSLAHLHSLLPILLGPEQLDFYLLVLQCPKSNNRWTFNEEKDGNLDILLDLMSRVLQENPIDDRHLSVFGLSSGGAGVWELITAYPDKFAAAVPTSSGAPREYNKLQLFAQTPVWAFRNKNDGGASVELNRQATQIVNNSGGYMKLTHLDQGGHAAWRPAMDEYNCFAWMIAQKRGGWFNPPPERKVYHGRSLSESFYAFFLPLILAGGLFMFQRTALCERLHERIADRLYRRDEDEEDEDDDEEEDEGDESTGDGFPVLTDITGTKKIKAKVLGFQGDAVRLQFPDGKIAPVAIKHFSKTDQELLRKMKPELPLPEGFRKWANAAGTQSFIAKFVGFQGNAKVLLQSQAGKTMPVPINQLGLAEQDFLAQERQRTAPSLDDFRTWSDIFGTNTFTAKLLEVDGDQVRLETQDGQEITMPIDELAVEDQILLTQHTDGAN